MAVDVMVDTGAAWDDASCLEGDTARHNLQTGGPSSDPWGRMLRRGREAADKCDVLCGLCTASHLASTSAWAVNDRNVVIYLPHSDV